MICVRLRGGGRVLMLRRREVGAEVEGGREGRRGWGGRGLDGEREGRVGRRGRWRGRSLLLPLLVRLLRGRGWGGDGGAVEVDDRIVVVGVAGVVEGARRRRGFGGWRRDRIGVAGVDSS